MADIYARDGQWLATAVWPANIRLHHWAVKDFVAFGIQTDSLGSQRIARLTFAP